MTRKKDVVLEIETEGAEGPKPTVEKVKKLPEGLDKSVARIAEGAMMPLETVLLTFGISLPNLGALSLQTASPRTEAVDRAVWLSEVAAEILRRLEPAIARAREQEEERRRQDAERARKEMNEWEAKQKALGRAFNPVGEVAYRGPVEKTDCAENESRQT